ncbi:hypothetical protein DBO86_25490 [Pseudomonas indoloxydans]|uniref:Uncharacterized protein n=1 Tax=Ectopseudomonas oleovorans TaxID=301 RepID=A0A2T5PCY6_ECTOL|nr:hypothetical protein [Pseudomonas indoloxydans]PTU75595.1 hypothetical protein DBO86_25490 [Pseudomonas indoloxydans]
MSTDPQQLLADAQRVDLATACPDEFTSITNRIQQTTLQMLRIDTAAQWVAAVQQHGSERDALAAARAELADVTCRLDISTKAKEALRAGKARLREDARLHDARSAQVRKNLDHGAKCKTLQSAIQQAEMARDTKVRMLVDEGVPLEIAQSSARPTLDDIRRLKDEHEAMPALMTETASLMKSSAALVRHVYPETNSAA